MALEQLYLETGMNKIETAIALLQAWEPKSGYYLAFSGGKDSVAIYDLAKKAGVKFDAHYCVSPIDPPQVYKFIKANYPDVIWDFHARGFWKIVDKKGLPMRNQRWCCQIIKEAGGENRVVITGNRRAEGNIRRDQCFVQHSTRKNFNKTFIRPILDFDNYDIWQYLNNNDLPRLDLYSQGFHRVGCVLCPFSRKVDMEIEQFPEITKLWRLACDRLVISMKNRKYLTKRGLPQKHKFETGQELFDWWVQRK